jgi:hypothetical protein
MLAAFSVRAVKATRGLRFTVRREANSYASFPLPQVDRLLDLIATLTPHSWATDHANRLLTSNAKSNPLTRAPQFTYFFKQA